MNKIKSNKNRKYKKMKRRIEDYQQKETKNLNKRKEKKLENHYEHRI